MNAKAITTIITVLGGVVVASLVKYTSRDKSESIVNLGTFAVWGRPNAGKTTFIKRLRSIPLVSDQKEATTSTSRYSKVKLTGVQGGTFMIDEIRDMPGTDDRRKDWLELVQNTDHVFYLVNLFDASERSHAAAVRLDVRDTIAALERATKKNKRIHLIFSHLDKSKWSAQNPAEVNNKLQADDDIRLLCESTGSVSGYVYSANLMDENSFQRLIQSIVNDCQL